MSVRSAAAKYFARCWLDIRELLDLVLRFSPLRFSVSRNAGSWSVCGRWRDAPIRFLEPRILCASLGPQRLPALTQVRVVLTTVS
jgi:hypothetical protein